MGEIIGHVFEGLGHILLELLNWSPQARYDSIGRAWAWPIAICLLAGISTAVAGFWIGEPWLYGLTIGAFVLGLAFVTVAAHSSKPRRSG